MLPGITAIILSHVLYLSPSHTFKSIRMEPVTGANAKNMLIQIKGEKGH